MAGLTKSLIQPSTQGKEDNNSEHLLINIEHENKVTCILNDKTTVKKKMKNFLGEIPQVRKKEPRSSVCSIWGITIRYYFQD